MQAFVSILYEDNHCLAVAKPAPLLTQGATGPFATLESLVKDYLRNKYGKKGRIYLGIPHRLDRPVSGVVLFARQTKSAQRLAEQFHQRQVAKVYWAAVEGVLPALQGTWEDWLVKKAAEARAVVAAPHEPGAKQAILKFRRLASTADDTLLELRPQTGRMHQLRVQTSARGWPIRGDFWYDAKRPFGPMATEPRERVIALHARSLTFLHPIRFEPIRIEAPLPEYWNELGMSEPPCADVSP